MNVAYSGGAEGSDLFWGEIALQCGHQVKHVIFENHPYNKKNNRLAEVVHDKMLMSVDEKLKITNKRLKRRFPGKNIYITNLLRRNYFQITETSSLYAICKLNLKVPFCIEGGTAWAVSLFLDKYLDNFQRSSCDRDNCHQELFTPIYVFDQENYKCWLQIVYDTTTNNVIFRKVVPPHPSGKYTAIGTRELNEIGKKAIIDVFENV